MSAIELETHLGLQGSLTSPQCGAAIGQSEGTLDHATGLDHGTSRDSVADVVYQSTRMALAESPILGIRGIFVEVRDRRVIISGRVHSFYHKQQAQEVVRVVSRGFLVVNNIEVISEPVFTPGKSIR